MRKLSLLALVVLLLPAVGEGERQVEWVPEWVEAFKLAREAGRPVMVCINSKDKERANETTAREIYHDTEFVALSRKFVMVVISTLNHTTSGTCPRFGKVTCEQHLNCWKELSTTYGEQLATAFAAGGEMISPQHVWFKPDGTLLRRKEYFLDKAELQRRMHKVLKDVNEKDADGPVGPESKDAPLNAKDQGELNRVKNSDREGRRAAVTNLIATQKTSALDAVVALLKTVKKPEVKCDILRGLGRSQATEARALIEEQLKDREALVRSFAAVALEELAQPESIPVLIKRSKSERDTAARKNMYRALGACAGPVADKAAAKALLKAVGGDKQNANKKYAALSLIYFRSDDGKKLVVKKLEKAALKAKDRSVRGGIVFTLAHIGNEKTTVPVFKTILESVHEDYSKTFLRLCIRKVKGEPTDFGRSAYFLYWEDRNDPARKDD